MFEQSECYHPVTRPPPNPNLRSRKTSKDQMQSNPNALSIQKNSSKHRNVVDKQKRLIIDNEKDKLAAPVTIERSVSWNNLRNESLLVKQKSMSASNLYALSDPNLSLKKAVTSKAYDKPNTIFAKEKAEFIAWSQKYYHQLTVGCGKQCTNRFCKSSSKKNNFKPTMCAILSVELSKYKSHYLCNKEETKQTAKVFDKTIFQDDKIKEEENSTGQSFGLPFLHSFYCTAPFRSLFLPCPLTTSGLGLHKTHSVNELLGIEKSEKNVSRTIKDHLCSLASNLSASLSNLLTSSENNNNNEAHSKTPKPMRKVSVEKSVSKNNTEEKAEHKTILTRKRLSSVRMFGDEHAVDKTVSSFDNIDDFESKVSEEFNLNNTNKFTSPQISFDQSALDDDEYSLTHLTLEMFTMVINNYNECNDESLLINTFRTVFSSWESLNLSFSDESFQQHTYKNLPFNLKISDVEEMFTMLNRLDRSDYLLSILNDTVKVTLLSKKENIVDISDVKPLAIILEIPNLMEHSVLLQEVANVISSLSTVCKRVFAQYLSQIPAKKFIGLVKGFSSQLLTETSWNAPPLKSNYSLCAICSTLEVLYKANNLVKPIIQNRDFYCTEMTAKIDFKQEYTYWKHLMKTKERKEQSILNYPFLLDPAVKVQVIHIDALTKMREEYQDAIVHQARVQQVQKSWNDFNDSSPLSTEVRSAMCPYLLLEIRRDHFIEDTLKQLQEKSGDLKKPLKIKYTAGGEQGLDMGGLQKEFFQVVVETMFDANYSLFTLSEDGNLTWFNAFSLESNIMFELVGILLGLAIYNGIILDVHFPPLVYKKLLGYEVSLDDLEDIQPTVTSGLKQLLEYQGDVENDFCLTFEASHSIYGGDEKKCLVANGDNILVTNDNRDEFVQLYVNYVLNESVDRQFNAFNKGFYQVCSGPTIQLFTPPELELLICGSPNLDFTELEKATEYKDGYTKSHALMLDFWEIVHKFTFKQKQALLMFVTGSYRVPLKGLGSTSFYIQRNGPDSNNLPTSMTCFNRLLLPEYASAKKLKNMLLLAVENAKGFGLT